ncbi:glycosyltransferase family 39 protein [Chitinophaga horti]|uniref:Glycosyltransferase family 39 protein n=1 Tax=Chitinophaga horti TaxID=2920382 RepID=A0ABY6J491_9BACT|nr:glycosyltransferase family 39 protein [Chitinophaga horti]UYQ94488.1 glycosyltransferase family 39 protein [Chitinophaga horti]
MQQTSFEKYYPWFIAAVIASLVPGLFTPLMEPDAALYASIAKQIVLRGDWINLYADGADWLDKPHLPFWLGAASFHLFGMNAFAWKLPAFLCWLAGARYTYLFAKHFYGDAVARPAALIYLCALHAIISANDVRAEPYLTLFLIATSYYLVKEKIVLASLFAAFALMTKGPFVLIPIGGGMLLHWGMTGDWKQLWRPKWYLWLILTFVFTLPELYCLYAQFDAQPDKVVFGRQQVSGIRFFLWDSQFGRFFNTGPIKGKGDPFFFLHTLLWAFLPFSLLLYAAIFVRLRRLRQGTEWISLGAGLLTMLVFSLSRFQLPHYLNILFPYFAVLLAAWLVSLQRTKAVLATQRVVSLIIIVLAAAINVLFRGPGWPIYFAVTALAAFMWYRLRSYEQLVANGAVASIALALFLNIFFYPHLLPYQGGSTTAGWLNRQGITDTVRFYRINSYSFDFIYNGPVQREGNAPLIYTARKGKASLDSVGTVYQTVGVFPSYKVTRLDGKFVNASTRDKSLDTVWVLRLKE